MRIFKLIGVAALMLAISAISVATASASLLPGTKGTKITGKSGKATLQVKGGLAITCKESKTTGEVESPELALALITFEPNCTAGGLPANSVGDAKQIILVHVEALTCADPTGIKQYILFKILPLKLEVPSTKLTIEVTGAVNGLVEPGSKKAKKFTVTLAQKEGVQTTGALECVNSKKETIKNVFLTSSIDGAAGVQSGQEATGGELELSAEEEFMA